MFTNLQEVEQFFKEREKLGIQPGLERMVYMLESEKHPEQKIKAIHVAGTNGKGSTIHLLNDALIANGYRVGVFTSPSMDGLLGHILTNHQPISTQQFINLLNQLYPSIKSLDQDHKHPSAFEILTVVAFMYFAENVDIALIETGMGGREDTTNCIQPLLSIITNVDFDHRQFLGDTIEKIAYHKAGIIKNNVPVILGEMTETALNVIHSEALIKNAEVYGLNESFHYKDIVYNSENQFFTWDHDGTYSLKLSLKLKGLHQVKNASLVVMALVLLKGYQIKINLDVAVKAIHHTKIPGRFETISTQPTIVIDGAHNPAGIDTFLKTMHRTEGNEKRHLIFAGFKDKDLQQMLNHLIPYFDWMTLTSFHHPRAIQAKELQKMMTGKSFNVNEDWQNVIDQVVNEYKTRKEKVNYYIVGSFHFITDVRAYLLNE